MVTSTEPVMGRFSVEVELTNDEDLVLLKRGIIQPDQVRRAKIRGTVDSGAAMLVIPESVAKQLGLTISQTTKVRYADQRSAERSVAERIRVRLAERESVFSAVLEPARESALIGAIILEALDLLVDCKNQRVVPRDPHGTIYEIE